MCHSLRDFLRNKPAKTLGLLVLKWQIEIATAAPHFVVFVTISISRSFCFPSLSHSVSLSLCICFFICISLSFSSLGNLKSCCAHSFCIIYSSCHTDLTEPVNLMLLLVQFLLLLLLFVLLLCCQVVVLLLFLFAYLLNISNSSHHNHSPKLKPRLGLGLKPVYWRGTEGDAAFCLAFCLVCFSLSLSHSLSCYQTIFTQLF